MSIFSELQQPFIIALLSDINETQIDMESVMIRKWDNLKSQIAIYCTKIKTPLETGNLRQTHPIDNA